MHKRARSFVIFMAGVLLGAVIYGNARRILSSPAAQTKTQQWEYRVVQSTKAIGLLDGNELNRLLTRAVLYQRPKIARPDLVAPQLSPTTATPPADG